MKYKKILVTGTAGFIGFHTAKALLDKGVAVIGIDNFSKYYDVSIKKKRNEILLKYPKYTFYKIDISNYKKLEGVAEKEKPKAIIHLAAQAGVRYSLINPWIYASSNFLGTLNIFEIAKKFGIKRVLYASSSSVYGSNKKMPFSESDRADSQISIYAASKKANEALAHSYHHLYKIETAGMRFFTVYGEYGRPDLFLFKFVKKILLGQTVDLYNNGKMARDFTYVDDIVSGILGILEMKSLKCEIYNLGEGDLVSLSKFVGLVEKYLKTKAKCKLLPMQAGDVRETRADIRKARKDFGYNPKTKVEAGVKKFVDWFMENKGWLLKLKD